MAITDIEAFTHLSEADIEGLADELDAIRQDITDSLGDRDARYIHRTIAVQRGLEVAGRARGRKVLVYKKKRRKKYRRRAGHRQVYTEAVVAKIQGA